MKLLIHGKKKFIRINHEKRLKIAFFEASRMVWGGGQKEAANTAAYLSKKHDVTVFTQKTPDKKLDFYKCKIKLIKPSHQYLQPIAFLFKKLKKSENFDLKIIGCFPATLSNLRNTDLPSIHITHSPPRDFYKLKKHLLKNASLSKKLKIHIKNIFLKKLDYLAAQKYTKILGISKEIKKRIKRDYHRESEIFYPGVDPKKYKTGKYGNYILSVTRMVSAKRPMMIAESMKYVKNKNIKMMFVGEGPFEEKIKKIAEKQKNIIMKGLVSEEELINLYANCLGAIYIPINEDYGYVPIEAGVSGKATIGVNEGGLKETIVDGKTGFLIDNITPQKVAEKIDILANNKNLAIKMGKAAKKHCVKFHLENTLDVLDNAIEEVMKIKKKKI